MESLIPPALTLVGVIITALVTWLVSRRSTKVQQEQQKDQNSLGLVDRYRSEIDRIDDKLDEQDEDIARLTQENLARTAEVLELREEMARARRDHLVETAKLEYTLISFRSYIAAVLDWINRRFESGELDTEVDVPKPPPEYGL